MRSVFIKDMTYRKARIVLTVISVTFLVLLILLMGGMMNGLKMQARDYVESVGRQAGNGIVWISTERSGSTFAGFSLLNSEHLEVLAQLKGVDKETPLSPLIFAQARPVIKGKEKKAVVVGYKQGKLGGPSSQDLEKTGDPNSPFYPIIGRLPQPSKYEDYRPTDIPPPEVIVDDWLGLEEGESIELAGEDLKVVGKTKGRLFVFDTPLLFMDIRTAQNTILNNIIYVNTILVKVAEGYSESQLANDIKDAKEQSGISIDVHTGTQIVDIIMANFVDEPMKGVRALRAMLWLAAGIIVAMITYVTTTEKSREIGVLKAIGASDRYVIFLTLKQVMIMTFLGIVLGIILAFLAAKVFPIMVLISTRESVVVAIVTMIICSYGGYVAAKKAAAVDPMIAFRGR
jgi:putative ABC transport system permease protein